MVAVVAEVAEPNLTYPPLAEVVLPVETVAPTDTTFSKLKDIEDAEVTTPPVVLILEPLAVLFTLVTDVPFKRTEPCTTLLALQELEEPLVTVAEPSMNLIRAESQAVELVAVIVELPSSNQQWNTLPCCISTDCITFAISLV